MTDSKTKEFTFKWRVGDRVFQESGVLASSNKMSITEIQESGTVLYGPRSNPTHYRYVPTGLTYNILPRGKTKRRYDKQKAKWEAKHAPLTIATKGEHYVITDGGAGCDQCQGNTGKVCKALENGSVSPFVALILNGIVDGPGANGDQKYCISVRGLRRATKKEIKAAYKKPKVKPKQLTQAEKDAAKAKELGLPRVMKARNGADLVYMTEVKNGAGVGIKIGGTRVSGLGEECTHWTLAAFSPVDDLNELTEPAKKPFPKLMRIGDEYRCKGTSVWMEKPRVGTVVQEGVNRVHPVGHKCKSWFMNHFEDLPELTW